MSKYENKLNHYLGLAYHGHKILNLDLDKEVIEYANSNPEFKQLMQDKLKEVASISGNRCVVSISHKNFLTRILEKLNG